jgi:hypothetical protein
MLFGKMPIRKSQTLGMELSTSVGVRRATHLEAVLIEGLYKSIDLAEKEYKGLVVGHQGADFSLGANLGLVFMYAIEQDYDEIDFMIKAFQNSVMRIRYSSIPVVVAPQGRTLGGGCEMTTACRYRASCCRNIYRFSRSWCWSDSRWWRYKRIYKTRKRCFAGWRCGIECVTKCVHDYRDS